MFESALKHDKLEVRDNTVVERLRLPFRTRNFVYEEPLGWSARICRVHVVGLRYALFVEFEKVERVLEAVDLVLDDCVVDVEWRVVPHEPRERHRIGCGCDVLRSDTSERSSTVCFQRKRTLLLLLFFCLLDHFYYSFIAFGETRADRSSARSPRRQRKSND